MSLRGNSYQCEVCGKEFSLKKTLEIHQLIHKGSYYAYSCNVCGHLFSLISSLQTHMLKHDPKTCSSDLFHEEIVLEEDNVFEQMNVHDVEKNRYDAHECGVLNTIVRTHPDGMLIMCPVCKKVFTHKAEFIMHLKLYNENESIVCPICEESLIFCDLVNQVKEHLDKFLDCPRCRNIFSSKEMFIDHMKSHDVEGISEHEDDIETLSSNSKNTVSEHDSKSTFQCSICKKAFIYQKSFAKHLLSHSEKKAPIKCMICYEQYSCEEDLKQHMLGHNKDIRKCRQCKKQFSNAKFLQKHVNQNSYNCKLCKESFSLCSDLSTHLRTHSKDCFMCSKHFLKLTLLRQHILSHTEEQECIICMKKYPHQLSLHRHMQAVHGANRQVQCDLCGKLYEKRYLKSHMLTHTGERPYKCNICERRFVQRMHLRTHMKKHTGEKKHKCSTCGRAFALKNTLIMHERTHTGERPYSCERCSKRFTTLSVLKQHLRTHNPNNEIKCQICGKMYTQIYALYAHCKKHSQEELNTLNPDVLEKINNFKVAEKPKSVSLKGHRFHCSVCGKGFSFKGNLEAHILLHTGEKPHSCTYCGKTFRLKFSLKLHERTHTGERPFQCSICQKGFRQYTHAKTHMVLHTGEKPYPCPICGKAFADKNNLSNHKKIHVKESSEKSVKYKVSQSIISAPLVSSADKGFRCTCDALFCSKDEMIAHLKFCSDGKLKHLEANIISENKNCDPVNYIMVTGRDEYCDSIEECDYLPSQVDNPSVSQIITGANINQPLTSHIILEINPDHDCSEDGIMVHEIEERCEEKWNKYLVHQIHSPK